MRTDPFIVIGEPVRVVRVSVNVISKSPLTIRLAWAMYCTFTEPGEYSPVSSTSTTPSIIKLELSSCCNKNKFSCNKKLPSLVDGVIEGVTDMEIEGVVEGVVEGVTEIDILGVDEIEIDGVAEVEIDGVDDGVEEILIDGVAEIETDGVTDEVTEGVTEGVTLID